MTTSATVKRAATMPPGPLLSQAMTAARCSSTCLPYWPSSATAATVGDLGDGDTGDHAVSDLGVDHVGHVDHERHRDSARVPRGGTGDHGYGVTALRVGER